MSELYYSKNLCVKHQPSQQNQQLLYNHHEMERLLLFHLDLANACTGVSSDENASEEELLEAVLLYIHNDGDNNNKMFVLWQ